MRLVTFAQQDALRLGVLVDPTTVVDVSHVHATMLDLVDAGAEGLAAVTAALADAPRTGLDAVALRAPIPTPRRDVFAVGLNYRDHVAESSVKDAVGAAAEYPAFFVKATGSVIGPGDEIGYPADISEQLDYEAEVAVVIGRRGRDISPAEAPNHVFGYMLANDVTVRDVQRRHGGQWNKGKSIDRSCPTGPFIVTADEVTVETLTIECEVNGEQRQSAGLDQLIFDVPSLVSHLSVGMTLQAGDVILTGTPSGVGYARKPPVFLRPGDRVTLRSNQLGELTNVVGHDLGPLPTR